MRNSGCGYGKAQAFPWRPKACCVSGCSPAAECDCGRGRGTAARTRRKSPDVVLARLEVLGEYRVLMGYGLLEKPWKKDGQGGGI